MPGRNSVDIKTNLDASKAQQQLEAFAQKVAKITGAEYTFKISVAEDKLDKAKTGLLQVSSAMSSVTAAQKESMTALGYYGRAVQETKNDVDSFRKSLNSIKNDTGVLGMESRSASKSVVQMVDALGRASRIERQYTSQTREATTAQREFSNAAFESERVLYRAQAIITGFAWNVFVRGIRDAIVELKNVDTELVTIQKVTGQTREQVQALADESYETAAKYGAIASDYLSSVASFARAGYAEQADALGELSLMTQKVGDVDAETADQFLLSVDAAYKYNGSIKELTKVLDGANEIGNKFATDVNKITAGLGIVSNVAKQANVDIDEVTAALGVITAVTQRSGSEAARALRAIYLNIAADISTEIDEDTGDHWTAEEIDAMSTSLQKFGIYTRYVKDGMEQLRNPMEVIGELAEKVKKNEITQVELNDLLQGLGGKLRSNQLLALISRWDMYEEMLDTYRNAAGSAEEELDIYLESWEAKIAQIKGNWTKLVNNTLSSNLVNNLLEFANKTLEAADSVWALVGAFSGLVLTINGNRVAQLITQVTTGMKDMIAVFTGAGSLAGKIGVFGLAISAISTLYMLYKGAEKVYFENTQAALKNAGALAEQNKQADELYSTYLKFIEVEGETTENQETVKEEALNVAEAYGLQKEQIIALARETGSYTEALEFAIQKKRELNALEYTNNQDNYIDALRGDTGNYLISRMSTTVSTQTETGETVDFLRDYNNTSIPEFIAAYQQLINETAKLATQTGVANDKYVEQTQKIAMMREQMDGLINAYADAKKGLYENTHGIIDNNREADEFVDWLIEEEGVTGNFALALGMAVRLLFDFDEASGETVDTAEEVTEKYAELGEVMATLSSGFTGLQSKFSSLQSIMESYNETGELTAEQFKSITDNGLLQYLDVVNGKLVLNEVALYDEADAAKASAIEQLRASYAADLLAFAEGRISDMSAGAQGALANAASSASTSADKAAKAAGAWAALGDAINYAEEAAMGDGAHSASYWQRFDVNSTIKGYYDKAVQAIQSLNFGGGSGSRGGGGGGGGSSKSSSSEKQNTYIDILKSLLTDADYQVESWTRDGNKEEAIIAMYERVMDEVQSVMDRYRAEGYDDTSDEIQELTKLWWKYADAIEDVHEDLAKRVKETWNELSDQVDDLVGDKTDEIDDQLSEAKEHYSDIIDTAKEEYKDLLSNTKDEYSALLDNLKTAYDEQVDALEDARDAEKEQLELEEKRLAILEAEQALLAAQNDRTVRKYNENGTWEWVADERAIQKAQENLDNAQKSLADYEAQLELKYTKEALKAEYEANKAALEEERDSRIADIENERDTTIADMEAERDARIAELEAEKEAFESEWDAIKEAIKEPGRDIADILSEIATNGTPAMKEQVDNITALLAKLGYDVAVVAGDAYGGSVSSDDSDRIKRFLSGDYSGAVFDSGGVAGMKGIMLKDTSDAETVLPPSLTKAIISPERNSMFTNFTDALARMFGISERMGMNATPIPNGFGNSDSHDSVYTINGIHIGSDEAQRPFYEVMRHIAVYSNMN